jgi:sugar phosphate isomerase/epimerase
MKTLLAVNTGFAVNRLTPAAQWVPFVKNLLGIDYVQFTADMIMPYMLDPLAEKIARRTRAIADEHGLVIHSVFTGAFTRLNHFSHPDPEVRAYWLRWFKALADVAVILGARSMGSHLGIQTMPDNSLLRTRQDLLQTTVQCWRELAEYASDVGLEYLAWEPMSISREYGETIAEADRILAMLEGFPLPMRLCLDVDHGDVQSPRAEDTDPYAWLEHFAAVSPLVHLKQSYEDKGGHWPFTSEHNRRGRIVPERTIQALRKGGAEEVCLILELSFRERQPVEARMLRDIQESVQFWKPYCVS